MTSDKIDIPHCMPVISDEEEEEHLLSNGSKRKFDALCFAQRIVMQLDEQVSVKLLLKIWGPRLELIVRLMLIATFLDDSLHSLTHFAELTKQISQQGCLNILVASSPNSVSFLSAVALISGLMAQLFGSFCIITLQHVHIATNLLIGWVIAQPFLFGQLLNTLFVAESLSLIGGLLMLQHAKGSVGKHVQLIGRLLLPAFYVYNTGLFFTSAITLDETNSLASFLSSLSMFVIYVITFGLFIICSTLVAVGLKSRTVASLLALFNLGYVIYSYPFFRFLKIEGGEWKVNDDNMWIPNVSLPVDVETGDLDPWMIYNLHRYYFFLGLSTSGALLLLAQFGPGDIALQKNEALLPYVSRAQD